MNSMQNATRFNLSLILIALLLSAGGCNVLGFAGQAINADTSKAVYTLPKVPTVVIAEKYNNPSESALDEEPVARFVTDDLRAKNIVPLDDADRVYTLRKSMSSEKWHDMTIDAVGR